MPSRTSPGPTPVLVAPLLFVVAGQVLVAGVAPGSLGPAVLAGAALHAVGGVLAWRSLRGDRPADRRVEPSQRIEAIAVVAVVALAASLRLVLLDSVPFRIDGDAAGF